jgi:hypothetical protein
VQSLDNEVLGPAGLRAFFFDDREVRMVLIKVQYDAYNRQFKLLDRELAHLLEDGETYVLLADVSLEDLKPTGDAEIASTDLAIYAT